MKHLKTFEQSIDKSDIKQLKIGNKGLNKLPDLSEYINLEVLSCGFNKITELPELPKKLKELKLD